MAITNSLAAKKKTSETNNAIAKFQANGMEVKLTPNMVKSYLVSGNAEDVTDQEVAMFINLCKYSGLNPWLKEAYLVKYSKNSPATLVTGKEAFMKRAESNPQFNGFEAGVIVADQETGDITYRPGTMKLANENLIGGYASVWRKDRDHAVRIEVSFDEYAGKKSDGSVNGQWSSKPATMIRKVALVQALREAFPTNLGGMYAAEEQGVDDVDENKPIVDAETGEVVGQLNVPKEKEAPRTAPNEATEETLY